MSSIPASGRLQDAERLIGSGSLFAQVSAEVATLLTRIKRGVQSGGQSCTDRFACDFPH